MRFSDPTSPTAERSRAAGRLARAASLVALLAVPVLSLSAAIAQGPGDARTQRTMTFTSVEAAFDQGVAAIRSGTFEIAIPALEYAGQHNHVAALYYLGMLYANNNERMTDHAKAYNAFHRIVESFANIDGKDHRAVFVVRAFVKLAEYARNGVPALGLKPDPREAVELLNHAAAYFGDFEAQFQLAKMNLSGEGGLADARSGLHWLSSLARRHHPGAQAFLAEQLWRGKHLPRDLNQALALVTLALENASEQDRIWIEDIYQTIYCGTPPGVREQAGQQVADWRRRAPSGNGAPGSENVDRGLPAAGRDAKTRGQGSFGVAAVRTCANGEPVPGIHSGGARLTPALPLAPSERGDSGSPAPQPQSGPTMHSVAAPDPAPTTPTFAHGFREVGKDGDRSGRR